MRIGYIIIAVVCSYLLFLATRKTEIIHLKELTHSSLRLCSEVLDRNEPCRKDELYRKESLQFYHRTKSRERTEIFIVANPPSDENGLLNLILSHFNSFAIDDTIEKFTAYYHHYYKETLFNTRHLGERYINRSYTGEDYRQEYREDKLMRIFILPNFNEKKITFYKKDEEDIEIILPWKKEEDKHAE